VGEPSIWRDYKAIDTDQGMVANFRNNLSLNQLTPLQADGVWKQICSRT